MPREIKTFDWCDICAESDQWVEGTETPAIAFGTAKPRTLLLCEPHMKELVEPLRALLLDVGTVTDAPPRVVRPQRKAPQGSGSIMQQGPAPQGTLWPCPVPECPSTFIHTQSRNNHLRTVHDSSIVEARETWGEPEPVPTENAPTADHICPECGRSFTKPQGMGRHRYSVHGITGTSKRTEQRHEPGTEEALL